MSAGGVLVLVCTVCLVCRARQAKPRAEEASPAEEAFMSITATVEGGDLPPQQVAQSTDTRPSSLSEAAAADSAPTRAGPVSRGADRNKLVASPQNLIGTQSSGAETCEASSRPLALRMPNPGNNGPSDIMSSSVLLSDSSTFISSAGGAVPLKTFPVDFETSQPQPAPRGDAPTTWLYESRESHPGDIPLDAAYRTDRLSALPRDATYASDIVRPVLPSDTRPASIRWVREARSRETHISGAAD